MSKQRLIRVGKIKISTIVIILAIIAFVTPVWVVGILSFDEIGWVFGLYWDASGFHFVSIDNPLFILSIFSTIFILAGIIIMIFSPIIAKRTKIDKNFLHIISGLLILYELILFSAGMDLAYPDWGLTRVISIWGYLPFIAAALVIISGLISMIIKRKESIP